MEPLVSIITPLYNEEEYLAETIESVLAQTYLNWELIIVDDISTDNSFLIAKEYTRRDKRIRVIQRKTLQKGGAVCRNIGIEESKGEYIIFLDADDLLHDECLKNRVKYMITNLHLDFCVFQMGVLQSSEKERYLTHEKENYLHAFLSYDLPWQTTCPIWQSKFIKEKLLGFDERYPRLQDPEFHTRALLVEGVRYEVLADTKFLDSSYRFIFKKSNISNALLGFGLYSEMIYNEVKERKDKLQCFSSMLGVYEAAIFHYSIDEERGLLDNCSKMKRINNFFYRRGLINKGKYWKGVLFLFYIKMRFYKLSFVNKLLIQLGFNHFYGYKISFNY